MSHSLCVMGVDNEVKMTVPVVVRYVHSDKKEKRNKREQPVGVPQGSPLSPVLSIAYTSPLLAKMGRWNNSSLGMYIDDGILFACAEEWSDMERLLRARLLRFAKRCPTWTRKMWMQPLMTQLWSSDTRYSNTRSLLYVRRRRSTSTSMDK
jgi:hypothetical protein